MNDIDTFDGKQGHKLDGWLADIEHAAVIVEENEVVVAKGKTRGLARDLIREHESQPWHHIKEQLRNRLNNASIHTYTSRFMEIQQKDSETLTAYIHRFKKEAKHCDFNSHPAKIRLFLKGLINSSRIAPSVYEKGPTTIEDATTQQQLDFLLRTFKDQFAKDETTIGTTLLTQMSIDMGDSDPVSKKPYPIAMKHYQWVKEEIDKLLEAGTATPAGQHLSL